MTASDNGNYASDFSLLFDPTPLTPGGDFLLAVTTTDDTANYFGATNRISWPISANQGVGTPLVDFKSASSWAAAGGIDLSTTGIFLGNSFGTTAAGATWTGTITLTYELPVAGFNLWSSGALASADTNGDGVKNAVAWVLGAASPAANATALVPSLDNTSDPNFLIFAFRRSDTSFADPKTTTKVQYGTSLSGWTDATPSSDVIITPSDDFYGAGVDKVEVKIRRTLAAGGKLFARLHVVVAP